MVWQKRDTIFSLSNYLPANSVVLTFSSLVLHGLAGAKGGFYQKLEVLRK